MILSPPSIFFRLREKQKRVYLKYSTQTVHFQNCFWGSFLTLLWIYHVTSVLDIKKPAVAMHLIMPCAQQAFLWLMFLSSRSNMPTYGRPNWREGYAKVLQAKFNSFSNTLEDTTVMAKRKCALKTAQELVTHYGSENWGTAIDMSRSIETLWIMNAKCDSHGRCYWIHCLSGKHYWHYEW